jgi:hypothetical protein
MPGAKAPIDLRDLIRGVEEQTPATAPLDRIALAMKYGEGLKRLGDDLVGHFVEEARAAECSWSQIGTHLGVTKQAAQQRHRLAGLFEGRRGRAEPRWFGRFTEEARQVVTGAQEEARRLNHNYLGTEHLLLALLRDRQAKAARALRDLGISLPDVRRDVKQIIGTGSEAPAGRIPFTPRAKKVFELGLRAAQTRGESHLRAHHILTGLFDEGEGVAAHILRDRGVTRAGLDSVLSK